MDKINNNEELKNQIIVGRNAVIEAIKSENTIDAIYICESKNDKNPKTISKIKAMARDKNIIVKNVTIEKLQIICKNNNVEASHQGVLAEIIDYKYSEIEDMLNLAASRKEEPFIIFCDGIEDPHNLGAIIRTAECCNVHGVVITKRHSANVNPTVYKTSAGAVSHMKIARVSNLANTIKDLKQKNVWFYCGDMDGTSMYSTDFSGGIGLVIGSEGKGVSNIVKQNCDFNVSIPLKGKINSLNASVAASVLMYEIIRKKG